MKPARGRGSQQKKEQKEVNKRKRKTTRGSQHKKEQEEKKTRRRGVESSYSKITGNKTLELVRVSPSNDLTRYKMESVYFYLISDI
jgi:hypothetical protein